MPVEKATKQGRYRVRYSYQIAQGIDPVTKERVYKTKTGNRTVTSTNPDCGEKELCEILEESHRKENPVKLRIKSFEKASDPNAPKGTADTADLNTRLTAAEMTIERLERQHAELRDAVNELGFKMQEREFSNSQTGEKSKPTENKPKENKPSGGGSKKS